MRTSQLALAASCLAFYLSVAQCGVDPITNINYCPDQNAAWNITNPNPSNTQYRWYRQNPDLTFTQYGYSDSFETPEVFPAGFGTVNRYFYEKEVRQTGGPNYPATPTGLQIANNATTPNFALRYNSTSTYVLNYVNIAVTSYFDDPNTNLRIKVGANGAFSEWFVFRMTDPSVVIASIGQTRILRIPVFGAPNQLGLEVGPANSQIRFITADGTEPAGTQALTNFNWIDAANLPATYTIGSTFTGNFSGGAPNSVQTVNGNANKIPAILNLDITVKCGLTNVTAVQETNPANCCVPVGTPSTVVSSTGDNIFTNPFPAGVTLTASGNSASLYYRWYKDGVPLGAAFEGVGLTTIPINDYANYTVRVVQAPQFINRSACFRQTPFDAQRRILFARTTDNSICLGESTNLIAEGATGPVSWSSLNGPLIQNANQQVATALPLSPGKYVYEVEAEVPIGNLVVNGSFENGNVGFTNSGYVFRDPTTSVPLTSGQAWAEGYPDRRSLSLGNGQYTINDYVFWPGYNAWKPCRGRGGVGNFLYLDGATGAGHVWEQTVNVVAGRTYEFGAWIMNINVDSDPALSSNPAGNPLPRINIFINGAALFPTPLNLSGAVCEWEKVSQTWTATTTGPITIRVDEISKANFGNDFAIDDIFFGSPGVQKDTVSVTVTDCNLLSVAQATCVGDSISLTATTNGAFIGWTNNNTVNTATIGRPTNPTTNVASGSGSTYTATAKFNFGNLITNGNFEAGNTGFTRTFDFLGSCCSNPGTFTIGNDPTLLNAGFVAPTGTGGTGRYYIGDGRFDASRRIAWQQTVNVPAPGEYLFSLDLANITSQIGTASAQTTQLEIRIGASFFNLVLPVDRQWRKYGFVFNVAAAGNVEIRISSLISSTNPLNGFAMDNLAFSPSITKTAEITPDICLPADFLAFTVSSSSVLNLAQWTVANELNVSHYQLQGSRDGKNFELISSLEATNSTGFVNTYQLMFEKSLSQFFRVVAVDFEGSEKTSSLVFLGQEMNNTVIRPNPFEDEFVVGNEDLTIEKILVFDAYGKSVETHQVENLTSLTLGQNWKSGVYLLKAYTATGTKMFKVVKR